MDENVTRRKLLEVNPETDSFLILDNLYGKSNVYHLADITTNHQIKLVDAFVLGSAAYILMSNSKGIKLNLLTKEKNALRKSEYQKVINSKAKT